MDGRFKTAETKLYRCPVCGKAYVSSKCLLNHLQKYSAERQFVVEDGKVKELKFRKLGEFYPEQPVIPGSLFERGKEIEIKKR